MSIYRHMFKLFSELSGYGGYRHRGSDFGEPLRVEVVVVEELHDAPDIMPAPLVHRHLLLGRPKLDQLGLEPLHREDPVDTPCCIREFLFFNLASHVRVASDVVVALLVRVLHVFEKL